MLCCEFDFFIVVDLVSGLCDVIFFDCLYIVVLFVDLFIWCFLVWCLGEIRWIDISGNVVFEIMYLVGIDKMYFV